MSLLKHALAATTALVLVASASTGHAAQITFTFDPSAAGVTGSVPFTGDTLNVKDYATVNITGAGTVAGTSNFTENGYLQLNNVSLGSNVPFTPTGENSAYSIYLSFNATGVENATSFNTSSTGVFNTLNYSLIAVDGASTFSVASGAPVVTNNGTPVTVATGSLIGGATGLSVIPNVGISPNATILETVNEAIPSFFVSPANTVLDLAGAFNNDVNLVSVTGGGTGFLLNGGGGDVTFTTVATPTPSPVPEPASMALLGAGLAGIGLMRRRRA